MFCVTPISAMVHNKSQNKTEPGSFLDLAGTGPQDRVNDGQCQGENGGGRTLLIAAIRSGLLDGT